MRKLTSILLLLLALTIPSTTERFRPTHDLAENTDADEEAQANFSALAIDPLIVDASAQTGGETMSTVNIQVGCTNFTAILYGNDSTQALLTQLPLTLNMSDLNANEKYYYLSDSLPADSIRVGSINAGDLMLYGSSCLVLFYESFSTSYSYTRLGYIEDASELKDALGSGSAQVTFSIPVASGE